MFYHKLLLWVTQRKKLKNQAQKIQNHHMIFQVLIVISLLKVADSSIPVRVVLIKYSGTKNGLKGLRTNEVNRHQSGPVL